MMGSPGQDDRYFDNQQFYPYPYDVNNDRRYDSSNEKGLRSDIIPKVVEKTSTHGWPMQQQRSYEREREAKLQPRSYEVLSKKKKTGRFVWKGVINCAKSGKVNIQAVDMIGSTDLIDLEMPSSLDIIGRIRPKMMWDYVNQTIRSGARDILVFKFTPASDADRKHYSSFLSHVNRMYKDNRLGVVGAYKLIKNFYVVPLPKDSPIPSALVSLSTALNENRTTCILLGVVLLVRKKREDDQIVSVPHKSGKISANTAPPSSAISCSPSLNYISTSRANSKMTDRDHPIAMLEEQNCQIEAQKHEQANMSTEVPSTGWQVIIIPGFGDLGLAKPSTTSGRTSIDTRAIRLNSLAKRTPASLNNPSISNLHATVAALQLYRQKVQRIHSAGLSSLQQVEQITMAVSPGSKVASFSPKPFSQNRNDRRLLYIDQPPFARNPLLALCPEKPPPVSVMSQKATVAVEIGTIDIQSNLIPMVIPKKEKLDSQRKSVFIARDPRMTENPIIERDEMEEYISNDTPDSPDFTKFGILPTQNVLQSTIEIFKEEIDDIGIEDDSFWKTTSS